jgi:short-subunit dehydrogenase
MAKGLALVTGASRGIGFELAKLFAEDGYDLVVAADDDAIQASAEKLGATGASVRAVQVGLRKPADVERLYRTATGAGRSLDAAVLNAGIGRAGPFVDGDLSFIQSFSEALHDELRGTGVTVTALMPRPTDTDFFRRGQMLDTDVGRMPKDDPGEVAKQGYNAPVTGDREVVAESVMTKAIGLANRMWPDSIKAVASRMISFRAGRNERSRAR